VDVAEASLSDACVPVLKINEMLLNEELVLIEM
jgi:hypothetical protein